MYSDTDPEAAEVQWAIMRKMTYAQRSNVLGSLTTAAFTHAKRAIAHANPQATQREIDHIFMSVHYGDELAQKVKVYLETRDACGNH